MPDRRNRKRQKGGSHSNSSLEDPSPKTGLLETKSVRKRAKTLEEESVCVDAIDVTDNLCHQFNESTSPINRGGQSKMASDVCGEVVTSRDADVNCELILKKLEEKGSSIGRLLEAIECMRSEIMDLKNENDSLRKEVQKLQRREAELLEVTKEAKHAADLALRKANDNDQYSRRSNLRIYGLSEVGEEKRSDDVDSSSGSSGEAGFIPSTCEKKVLRLFRSKLNVNVEACDVEAAHRLGRKKTGVTSPRGIIVRFVNRKMKELILSNRKKLKGQGVVIVEDLTPTNYSLFSKVKEHEVCQQAWTKNGKVYMKTKAGHVIHVKTVSDLVDITKCSVWTSTPKPKTRPTSVSALDRTRTVNRDPKAGREATQVSQSQNTQL